MVWSYYDAGRRAREERRDFRDYGVGSLLNPYPSTLERVEL